jgi:hypothetical protein
MRAREILLPSAFPALCSFSLVRPLAGWLAGWHSRYGEVGTFITRKWQESSAAAVVAAAASLENGIENKNILPLKVYQAK